jgi:hypothetical protein
VPKGLQKLYLLFAVLLQLTMQLSWHDFIQAVIKFYAATNLFMAHRMVLCLQVVIHAKLAADAQQAPNFVHFDIPIAIVGNMEKRIY